MCGGHAPARGSTKVSEGQSCIRKDDQELTGQAGGERGHSDIRTFSVVEISSENAPGHGELSNPE